MKKVVSVLVCASVLTLAACGAADEDAGEGADALPEQLLKFDPSACVGTDGTLKTRCGSTIVGNGEVTLYDIVTRLPCRITVNNGTFTAKVGDDSLQAQMNGEDADRLLTISGRWVANSHTAVGLADTQVNLYFTADGLGPVAADFVTAKSSYNCITEAEVKELMPL